MSGNGAGQENGLIRKVKLIQQRELEQREVFQRFVAHFSNQDQVNTNSLLQNVIEDYTAVEEESRNLWNKNAKLQQRLADKENELKVKEGEYVEELRKHELSFSKAEQDFKDTNDALRKQIGENESEISAKNHTMRRLEDECSQLRVAAGQVESKLDSMHSEMASLDSAMASLHGEISALQRELDEAEKVKARLNADLTVTKKVEETLSGEVQILRQEKIDGDKSRDELELQVAELTAQHDAADIEVGKRVQNLAAERDLIQANLAKKESKLKQQGATNQELNELVSKMHNDLISERQNKEKVVGDKENAIANLTAEMENLKAAVTAAQDASTESNRQQMSLSDQLSTARSKLSSMQQEIDLQAADNKKLTKRADRLEREKQDLLMEISDKAQAINDLQKSHDALKSQHNTAADDLNDKDKIIMSAKMDLQLRDTEIRQLQNEVREKGEFASEYERQLHEEKKLKEVSLEAARAQQREHATRIVESNQKSSRFASDLVAAQNTIETLKKQIIDASSLISTYEKEKEEYLQQQTSTHSKLQTLEDRYEESVARLDASDAELEDVKLKYNNVVYSNQKESEEKNRKFNIELTNQAQKSKKEIEDLRESLKSAKRQAEVNLERSLTRARTSFQRQLEELQTSHCREISDARNRVATVATAMDSLQRELRDECAKNSELLSEIEMLREMTDSNTAGAEDKLSRMEKERAKERDNYEGIISNIKSQLKTGSNNSVLLQQQLDAAVKQLHFEKDERNKTEKSLREIEEKFSKNVLSTEKLESAVFTLKKQLSDNDKKVSYQMQQKIDEIQRVTRRNEVLSEAVTRLTQMNSSEQRSQSGVIKNENKYVFDDTDRAKSRFASEEGNSYKTERSDNSFSLYEDSVGRPLQNDIHQQNHYPPSSSSLNDIGGYGDNELYGSGRKSQTPSKSGMYHHTLEYDTNFKSPDTMNSSMLRVQQALDIRRKHASPHVPGSNSRNEHYENSHKQSSSDLCKPDVLLTPDRSAGSRRGVSVPLLQFNSEFEKEIVEDRSPRSDCKDGGGLFAVRIRDEVEQGKERLLPFSPKSASRKSRTIGNNGNADNQPHQIASCKTEREIRSSASKGKPDRALSAPMERMSRDNSK